MQRLKNFGYALRSLFAILLVFCLVFPLVLIGKTAKEVLSAVGRVVRRAYYQSGGADLKDDFIHVLNTGWVGLRGVWTGEEYSEPEHPRG